MLLVLLLSYASFSSNLSASLSYTFNQPTLDTDYNPISSSEINFGTRSQ